MLLKISHRTTYKYNSSAPYALQQLRLTPKDGPNQTVKSWTIETDGGKEEVHYDDQNDNHVTLVSFDSTDHQVSIICTGEVETHDTAGVVGQHKGCAPLWYFKRSTPQTEAGSGVKALAKSLRDAFNDDVELIHALSQQIIEQVAYETGQTHASTTAEEALKIGKGVCQDHAHIFISAARQMGFPARYVSGYLMMNDRDYQEASHAWAEVHLPALGWVGIDVSNSMSPDEKYVRIATGLDYNEAAPISGISFGDNTETMSVQLQVQQ